MQVILSIITYALVWAWIRSRFPREDQRSPSDESIRFSVVVPFRDEEANLPALLRSIPDRCPHQWIFVDDHSSDGSAEIVGAFIAEGQLDAQVLSSLGEGKKSALQTGIRAASEEWILQLDADVVMPEGHLDRLQRHASGDLVVLPLAFEWKPSFFASLDLAEMSALESLKRSGSGSGEPEIANGAHLLYRRSAFLELDPFREDGYSSGDDMFILQKMKEAKKEVRIVASSELAVRTGLAHDAGALISQRLRWLSKVGGQSTPWSDALFVVLVALKLLFLFSISMLLWDGLWPWAFCGLWVGIIIEALLLHPSPSRLPIGYWLYYPWVSVLQPLWHGIIPILAIVMRPTWKGRSVRK